MDAVEKRIAKVSGTAEVPQVSEQALLKYREYLLQHLDRKALLTGREDFPWEEFYVFGPGDKEEYENLKKTRPAHTDEFQLMDISASVMEEDDLLAQVKRLSDGRVFEMGLSWLTTKMKKGKDYQLLDDFATWQVNW
jgi:hypothetical protein